MGDADHARTYRTDAARYDRLVRAEDREGALAAVLLGLLPVRPARVLDVGAGTGRVARLLGDAVAEGVGVEPAGAMRRVAEAAAAEAAPAGAGAHGRPVWRYVPGDARALPRSAVPDAGFDLGVAAWVFGHLRQWRPAAWRAEVAQAVGELRRAVRPGGVVVVVDTLGTGTITPAAPTPALAEYHAWLEREAGLARRVVRTDYRFASAAEAVELTGAFFGTAMAARVAATGSADVPECTGVWSAHNA